MIRIRIDAASALAVLAALNVGNLRGRLQQAVRNTMRDGRTEAKSKIEQRYTAKSPLSLGKVSMRTSGLHGRLTFSGKRNALKRFILHPDTRPPHRPPGGLFVQVVRGSGGYLPHAFIGKGKVWERSGIKRTKAGASKINPRTGRKYLREKLKYLGTISLSGMARAVSSSIFIRLKERLAKELNAALELI